MVCRCTSVPHMLLLLSTAWAMAALASESEVLEESVLSTDDECHAGSPECSLNALQMKARQASAEAKPISADDSAASSKAHIQTYTEELSDYANVGNETDEVLEANFEKSWHHGPVVTGYHQTSPEIGRIILKHGFRPGHAGYCGGGIYFAASAWATTQKAIGHQSHHGFIIEARIDLGRIKNMGNTCVSSRLGVETLARGSTAGYLHRYHADSFVFDPIDGREYVIANPHRVVSMRQFR